MFLSSQFTAQNSNTSWTRFFFFYLCLEPYLLHLFFQDNNNKLIGLWIPVFRSANYKNYIFFIITIQIKSVTIKCIAPCYQPFKYCWVSTTENICIRTNYCLCKNFKYCDLSALTFLQYGGKQHGLFAEKFAGLALKINIHLRCDRNQK